MSKTDGASGAKTKKITWRREPQWQVEGPVNGAIVCFAVWSMPDKSGGQKSTSCPRKTKSNLHFTFSAKRKYCSY